MELAPITVNDGTSDITFTPSMKDGLNVVFTVAGNSVKLSKRIQLDAKPINSASNRKMVIRVTAPETVVVDQQTSVVKDSLLKVEFSAPLDATTDNLSRLLHICANALLSNIITDAIVNGNQPY
nr:MAG: coat protein [Leviviridae sp.]